MCSVLRVHPSGYYKWLKQPISNLEQENQKLFIEIKKAYKESNGIYGYRNIHKDLKASNIHVNKKRVARLMKESKLCGIGNYRRKPKYKAIYRVPDTGVILHSDQGSQYSSYEYKTFLKHNKITPSMSRRGNCYDNAVAESFFKTLKKELVRKNIFHTRKEAKDKIFEYIEMFYNSKRRHSYLGFISPNEFEKKYNENLTKH